MDFCAIFLGERDFLFLLGVFGDDGCDSLNSGAVNASICLSTSLLDLGEQEFPNLGDF